MEIKDILKTIIISLLWLSYIIFILPASFVIIGLSFDSASSANNPLTYIIDGLILFGPLCLLIYISKCISKI